MTAEPYTAPTLTGTPLSAALPETSSRSTAKSEVSLRLAGERDNGRQFTPALSLVDAILDLRRAA